MPDGSIISWRDVGAVTIVGRVYVWARARVPTCVKSYLKFDKTKLRSMDLCILGFSTLTNRAEWTPSSSLLEYGFIMRTNNINTMSVMMYGETGSDKCQDYQQLQCFSFPQKNNFQERSKAFAISFWGWFGCSLEQKGHLWPDWGLSLAWHTTLCLFQNWRVTLSG